MNEPVPPAPRYDNGAFDKLAESILARLDKVDTPAGAAAFTAQATRQIQEWSAGNPGFSPEEFIVALRPMLIRKAQDRLAELERAHRDILAKADAYSTGLTRRLQAALAAGDHAEERAVWRDRSTFQAASQAKLDALTKRTGSAGPQVEAYCSLAAAFGIIFENDSPGPASPTIAPRQDRLAKEHAKRQPAAPSGRRAAVPSVDVQLGQLDGLTGAAPDTEAWLRTPTGQEKMREWAGSDPARQADLGKLYEEKDITPAAAPAPAPAPMVPIGKRVRIFTDTSAFRLYLRTNLENPKLADDWFRESLTHSDVGHGTAIFQRTFGGKSVLTPTHFRYPPGAERSRLSLPAPTGQPAGWPWTIHAVFFPEPVAAAPRVVTSGEKITSPCPSVAERDAVAAALKRHLAAGRLPVQEFEARIRQVLVAATCADLASLLADLPEVAAPQPTPGSEKR